MLRGYTCQLLEKHCSNTGRCTRVQRSTAVWLWYCIQSHRCNSRQLSLFFQPLLIPETLFQLSYHCSFPRMCIHWRQTSQPSSHSCGKTHLRSRERIRNNIVLGRILYMIFIAKPAVVYLQSYNKLFDCLHCKPIL